MKLRLRLLVLFSVSVLAALSVASFLAWHETREEIYEILDAQQVAFLKHLATSDIEALLEHGERYEADNGNEKENIAFAIYDEGGRLLLNNGLYGLISPDMPPNGEIRINTQSRWRAFWQRTPPDRDGTWYIIVVGQHMDYRDDAAADAVENQLMPWLFLFPILFVIVLWMLNMEFKPIEKLSSDLGRRRPDDERPIDCARIPSEIRPLVEKLNLLFARMGATLRRERRFTADAAHELRSPLAGLRVQAEVAQLAVDDAAVRERALVNLTQGIDRTARLVEQLLTLSRLDALGELGNESDIAAESVVEEVDIRELIADVAREFRDRAKTERVEFSLRESGSLSLLGSRPLLEIMVHNVLDNAFKYVAPGGLVDLTLTDEFLRVADNGPGVDPQSLPKLGERFFRVLGQKKIGTGLGLSIVRRVAELHDMRVEFDSPPECGLCVTIYYDRSKRKYPTEGSYS